jgi:hypothetical protein
MNALKEELCRATKSAVARPKIGALFPHLV